MTPQRLCDKVPASLEKRNLESKLNEAQQEDSKKKDLPLADKNNDSAALVEVTISCA